MCGRYRLSKRKHLIEEYFETANEVDWEPRYNIAPSPNIGIVRLHATRPLREFSQVRWGLIPSWAQEASVGHKMINARSETVADKPPFETPSEPNDASYFLVGGSSNSEPSRPLRLSNG